MTLPSIVWFRQDLRLEDQPALNAAIAKGGAIIPLFIWSPEEEKEWAPGAASRWWLHGALNRLQNEFRELGGEVIIRQGSSFEVILDVLKETGADAIFWNRRYEPFVIERDAFIKAELRKKGIKAQSFNGSLLFEPWQILNKQQKPYQIFTHFWNFCSQLEEPSPPLPKPRSLLRYDGDIQSDSLEQLNLLPTIPWDKGFIERWQPQTDSPKKHLHWAVESIVATYTLTRDVFAEEGTSTLSPYLHFGEISPRMIWDAVRKKNGQQTDFTPFLRQLGWREFAYYLLFHFPQMASHPLRLRFNAMPWEANLNALHAWQKGMTGYPIVDAGMRQLWHTGWMHNRARMIVGSFLVKDLLIDWREGARWFWDTLVDANLANNSMGWQWVSGCGVDAAPYFRVFNPVTQGEKFDANGDYVRRWVPELGLLPNRWIHRPWEAPKEILRGAGIQLGVDYPEPIVDHGEARKRALAAYAASDSAMLD